MRWAAAPPHVSLCDVPKGLSQLAHFLEYASYTQFIPNAALRRIDNLEHKLHSLSLSGIQGMSASGEYSCFARLTALTRLEFIAFRFSSSPLQRTPIVCPAASVARVHLAAVMLSVY